MKTSEIATVEDAIAWLTGKGAAINALMQHNDKTWRCSVRVKRGERGMTGQHFWVDDPTPFGALKACCLELESLTTAPARPTTPVRRVLPVVDEPGAAPPHRRAPVNLDDVV
jgi:hypothetical protein